MSRDTCVGSCGIEECVREDVQTGTRGFALHKSLSGLIILVVSIARLNTCSLLSSPIYTALQ